MILVGWFSLGDNRRGDRGRWCSDGTRRVSEGDRTGSGVDVALLVRHLIIWLRGRQYP